LYHVFYVIREFVILQYSPFELGGSQLVSSSLGLQRAYGEDLQLGAESLKLGLWLGVALRSGVLIMNKVAPRWAIRCITLETRDTTVTSMSYQQNLQRRQTIVFI